MIQYYKIGVKNGKIEFHTGTDQSAVSEMKSLNHGIPLGAAYADRTEELMRSWHNQVKIHKLKPA